MGVGDDRIGDRQHVRRRAWSALANRPLPFDEAGAGCCEGLSGADPEPTRSECPDTRPATPAAAARLVMIARIDRAPSRPVTVAPSVYTHSVVDRVWNPCGRSSRRCCAAPRSRSRLPRPRLRCPQCGGAPRRPGGPGRRLDTNLTNIAAVLRYHVLPRCRRPWMAPPLCCERSSADTRIVSGSGVQWGSFRCCSEDVGRALAECCATAYGVASCIGSVIRDPGASRRGLRAASAADIAGAAPVLG